MKYYLLDYENVNASGLDGISDLSEDCKIVLFYTRNSNKIDLGIFNVLRNMKAEISIIEVHHGKQALDIQLASYLGYLIGTEPEDTEYYIISKDKGYRNVQSFWPERRIVLCRNLSPDSEIIDEPSPKKSSSKSGSRGGRKSSSAKAAAPAKKSEPEKASEPAKAAEPEKAAAPAEAPAPAEEPKSKAKPAKSSANAKAKDKPAAEEKPADEPKPNAFAEAAAIAKAVVEAKKARNEAAEKKDPAAPEEAPAKKEPAKKTSAKKAPAKKSAAKKESAKKEPAKKEPTKKESAKKEAAKKEPAKKEPAKKEAAKKSPAKQKDSDMRNEVNNEIQKRLSKEGIPGDIINSTASFVSKNIGKDGYKQTIYRGIIKEHGQKMGLTIYRLIKDLL